MNRTRRLVVLVALAAGALGGAAAAVPAAATTAVVEPGTTSAAAGVVRVGVDDFRFASFDAEFDLGTDADGRSTLTTTETLVAVFPDGDQNRGIQRALPEEIDGHPSELELVSVTDENGTARPVETDSDDGFLVVTSAADDYVHGEQTYVITYTQSNVTLPVAADGAEPAHDEFYRDVNGTAWRQPFDRVSARVVIPSDLAASLTGELACYEGSEGSTELCSIDSGVATDGSGDVVVTATAEDLRPTENATIAIGFEEGTFVPRDSSPFATPVGWILVAALVLAALALGLAVRARATVLRDAPGRPTIVAEYDPPAISTVLAAGALSKTHKAVAAGLVDLAVRGIIRIEDDTDRESSGWAALTKTKGDGYRLRLVDPTGRGGDRWGRGARDLSNEENALLDAVFGSSRAAGTVRELGEKDASLTKRIQKLIGGLPKRVAAAGLRDPRTAGRSTILAVLSLVATIAVFVSSVMLLADARGGAFAVIGLIVGVLAFVGVLILVIRTPLTAAGAELRDHVAGLDEYIRLAEADRLAMLQSPEGAARRETGSGAVADAGAGDPTSSGATTGDTVTVVRITERLLPWAVLLGHEDEWSKVLGSYYERYDDGPDWYASPYAFSGVAFTSSLSTFSSSIAANYSGSASSSSSGGASGGGSSGGGSGGGGGGGV